MQLNVNVDVYEKFCELKRVHNNSDLTDSDFLSRILNHLEIHGFDSPSVSREIIEAHGSEIDTQEKLCPECKFLSHSSEELSEHFESAHAEKGSFSCTCGDSYGQLPDFLRHYVDCPVAATDLQDTRRSSTVKRNGKRRRMDFEPLNEYPLVDSMENSDNNPYETYYSYRHPPVSPIAGPSEEKPYGCPKCYKGFKSKSLLDQHMHLHYPPRYKCRWCGNVYRWPPVYYHHKQKCKKRPIHCVSEVDSNHDYNSSEESPYKVEDSSVSNEQVAMAQRTLAQFMNIHGMSLQHSDSTSNNMPSTFINGGTPSCSFPCICSEIFPTLPSYLEHAKTCSSILSASTVLENFTPQALLTNSNVGLDLSTQSVELKSEENGVFISDKPVVHDLSLQQNSGVNGIFTCSICGKDFNSKLSLKQHVDGKHRAEGKYLCPTCGKRYRWGASFYYHKKTCFPQESTNSLNTQSLELLTTRT